MQFLCGASFDSSRESAPTPAPPALRGRIAFVLLCRFGVVLPRCYAHSFFASDRPLPGRLAEKRAPVRVSESRFLPIFPPVPGGGGGLRVPCNSFPLFVLLIRSISGEPT